MRCALFSLVLVLPVAAQVHTSPMAGRWFAGEAAVLRKQVDEARRVARLRLGGAPPRPGIAGLIVPHAGLDYSGVVAAGGWGLAAGMKPGRTVILLGFSHKRPLRGVAIPKVSAYRTPLGAVPVDNQVARELGFARVEESELCDHSIENQLPFLQDLAGGREMGGRGFVPVYVGGMTAGEMRRVAATLAARAAAGDLIAASTDFTHHGAGYGYQPFGTGQDLEEKLRERALESFEQVGSLDATMFDRFLRETGDTMCGVAPVRLLMTAMAALERGRQGVYMSTVDYVNSGQVTHDWNMAVSYGALAFYPAASFGVEESGRAALLRHARAALDGGTAARQDAPGTGDALRQRTGVFVTIKKNGALRGCIGTLSPREDVWASVADRTLAAAHSDPRFPPLTASEGPVTLEVSLLTPLKRLPGWRAWRPGMGGVLVMGDKGGLLLPQIATENGWGRQEFLRNLAAKAGLPEEAYRGRETRLYGFEAQVFAERAH